MRQAFIVTPTDLRLGDLAGILDADQNRASHMEPSRGPGLWYDQWSHDRRFGVLCITRVNLEAEGVLETLNIEEATAAEQETDDCIRWLFRNPCFGSGSRGFHCTYHANDGRPILLPWVVRCLLHGEVKPQVCIGPGKHLDGGTFLATLDRHPRWPWDWEPVPEE
jgi:hypothetical protein